MLKSIALMYFKAFVWLGSLFGLGMVILMVPVIYSISDMYLELGLNPVLFCAKMLPIIFVSSFGIYGTVMSAFLGTLNLFMLRRNVGTILPQALPTKQERLLIVPDTSAEAIRRAAEAIKTLPNTTILHCDDATGQLTAVKKFKWHESGRNIKITINAHINLNGKTEIAISVIPLMRMAIFDGGNSYVHAEIIHQLLARATA